jgi:RNA recognition motif-containing protein
MSQDSGTQLFVGNLPFTAKEQDIIDALSKIGPVSQVNLISNYGRSKGYAFVEFESKEIAENALKSDPIEMDGRVLKIEEPKQKQQNQINDSYQYRRPYNFGRSGGGGGGGRYNSNYNNYGGGGRRFNDYNSGGGGGGYYSNYNSGGGGGGRFQSGPPQSSYQNSRSSDDYDNVQNGGYNNRPRFGGGARYFQNPGFRRPFNNRGPPRNNFRRQYQAPNQRLEDQEFSSTTIYVSNIPFSYSDGDLFEIFSQFKPKSARVIFGRNGKSRGYGFVSFDSDKEQSEAISEFDGCEVEGEQENRRINVKRAHKSSEEREESNY